MIRTIKIEIWMDKNKDFDELVKSIQEYLHHNRQWERYNMKSEPFPDMAIGNVQMKINKEI